MTHITPPRHKGVGKRRKGMKRVPKTCWRCKASVLERGSGYKCNIGFKCTGDAVPLEICPKPKTIIELVEWKLSKEDSHA